VRTEPNSEFGLKLKEEAENRAWRRAVIWTAVLMALAFYAAWRAGRFGAPGDIMAFQATFLLWVAVALTVPANVSFFFRNLHPEAGRRWYAFWTVAWLAFAMHLGWTLAVTHGWDVAAMLAVPGDVPGWAAPALAALWFVDLAFGPRSPEPKWLKALRIAVFFAVLAYFVWQAVWGSDALGVKIAGWALMGATLAAAQDAWRKRHLGKKGPAHG